MNFNYSLNKAQPASYVDAFSGYGPADFNLTSAPNYQPKLAEGFNMNPGASLSNFNFGAGTQPGGGGIFGNIGDMFKNSGFMGSTDKNGMKTDGWGGMALSTVSGLMNAYMGMKQYGLAKQTLAHNKDVFNKNYTAQKQTTNAAFEDRQRARVASNPGAYVSVGDYMKKNGIA